MTAKGTTVTACSSCTSFPLAATLWGAAWPRGGTEGRILPRVAVWRDTGVPREGTRADGYYGRGHGRRRDARWEYGHRGSRRFWQKVCRRQVGGAKPVRSVHQALNHSCGGKYVIE